MRVIGIDTGPEQSAMAVIATSGVYPVVQGCGMYENAELAHILRLSRADQLVVERISPRHRFIKFPGKPKGGGMRVVGAGYDVLLAAEWAGVFRGAFQSARSGGALHRVAMVERPDVCRWATGSVADKSAVHDAVAALWKMSKKAAVAKNGPLAGLSDAQHTWDAAEVALYWLLTHGWTVELPEGFLAAYDSAVGQERLF